MTSPAAVARYVAAVPPPLRELTGRLVALVDAELPGAEALLWHGHPVWRLAGEPAVLVKAYPKHVTLGFWRGQRISADLTPGGRQEMASVRVTGDVPAAAADWLRRARELHAVS